ncbi:MAG: ORF6N domain-containing protein [Candidatus Saganbacteria bacterium]|nr:ORF6N domain-containing protein [Candidatus Saganbacteria bacterium]
MGTGYYLFSVNPGNNLATPLYIRGGEKTNNLIPIERIENKIYLIRGQKVMLDSDLAKLYDVKTFVLNQAVKRNIDRFPEDFMFSLSRQEILRISQIVISSTGRGNETLKFSKNINVFTEQGVAMLSSVLRSKRAAYVNIAIMRAFVKLRQVLSTHKELAQKLKLLEQKTEKHDTEIKVIFDAIRQLMTTPEKPKQRIGFNPR